MIEKNMPIEDIIKRYPETQRIFEYYGMGCAGCKAALFESIEQGASIHGIEPDALINALNNLIKKQ
ncbi:MAG: DUF1858 domain-containing protein [Syntrophorhabdaceae bacterium]|nr:DUF1858 domain-containing protein [Syntrophorhabdales bacterium]MBP9560619.1 DUF1858 domain-containing protein [Syntrophorhabdaceae bacterium]